MHALAAALALVAAAAPVAPPETPAQVAARLAARQFPAAKWRVGAARQADFTFDGKADVALLGTEGKAVVLVVVEGPITDASRLLSLRFPSGQDSAAAICGAPDAVQANTEVPSARCAPGQADCDRVQQVVAEGADAGGLGLVLVHARATGYCEAFHVHFDGKGLSWWREPERE